MELWKVIYVALLKTMHWSSNSLLFPFYSGVGEHLHIFWSNRFVLRVITALSLFLTHRLDWTLQYFSNL